MKIRRLVALPVLLSIVACGPTEPTLERVFESPQPVEGGGFGLAFAVSGDLLAIGAPGEGEGAAGRVYVYELDSGTLRTVLAPPASVPSAAFGAALATAGDTLYVGAPVVTGSVSDGAVYAFHLPDATLERIWRDPVAGGLDYFGAALAAAPGMLAVGAPGAAVREPGVPPRGAVYLFDPGTDAPPARTLVSPLPVDYAEFGAAIELRDSTIAIGEPRGAPARGGSIHLFDRITGALVASIADPVPTGYDTFGSALALRADSVIVGDPQDSTVGELQGMAYVLTPGCTKCTQQLVDPAPTGGERFGASVALDDDLLAIGVPLRSHPSLPRDTTGEVVLVRVGNSDVRLPLPHPQPRASAGFGAHVGFAPGRLLVGETSISEALETTGRVYVFRIGSRLLR